MLDDLSDENKYPISFSIDDAKVFFENNATDLAPLSFQEKSISRSTPSSGLEIHPEWEKSMTSGHEGVTLIEIPLRSSSMVYSIESIYKNGVQVSNFSSVSERRLIVAKRADGEIDMFIATIIPKCQDSQGDINKTLRDFRYLGGGSFSGNVFCSTLDGRFVKAFGYKNGKMNGTLNTRVRNAEGKQDENNIDSDYSHFQILEASPGLSRYSSSESGGSTGNKCMHGYLYSECPFNCILPGGEIPGVDVVVCRYCHSSSGCNCPKCFWCNQKERECRCTVCIKCKKKMQECKCYMYPDPTDPVNPPPGGGGKRGNRNRHIQSETSFYN